MKKLFFSVALVSIGLLMSACGNSKPTDTQDENSIEVTQMADSEDLSIEDEENIDEALNDAYSDAQKEAQKIYDEAQKEAEEIYEEAQKEANKAYNDAMEDALNAMSDAFDNL